MAMVGVFEIHPADDGGDRLGYIRVSQHVLGFLDRGRRLDQNGPHDVMLCKAGGEILGHVFARENGVILGHPVVVPLDAVRFGCATAGISVTRPGTAPSMPALAEVEALMRGVCDGALKRRLY